MRDTAAARFLLLLLGSEASINRLTEAAMLHFWNQHICTQSWCYLTFQYSMKILTTVLINVSRLMQHPCFGYKGNGGET